MQRLQAYRYELRPDGRQERQMRCFAGACRFVYNQALALQKQRFEAGEKKPGYAGLCRLLTGWRHSADTAWLAEVPVHPLQQALKDVERAYANFFAGRAALPRFRKKGRSDSFRYPDPKQIRLDQTNRRLFLPRLGWVRYRHSRDVLGAVKNVTVSTGDRPVARTGKWYVSIQTEREVEPPLPTGGAVGVDMGIARFATLSDGTFYAPRNSFRRHECALRKAQQAGCRGDSRSRPYFSHWKKAKARVQKIHARIANVRRDFLHKVSTAISKNHAFVCIEDLAVRNMSRSAAGAADAPGREGRPAGRPYKSKSGLNKSILDQGWFEFRRQLDYKLAWNGGRLMVVPPQNTSRTCPRCGHVSADNRQTQARFRCVACGFGENADMVGAINILSRGIQMLRDEGRDTINALIGMPVGNHLCVSPDGLWIEPHKRSEAGTRRSVSGAALCRA
ncbi:transposase [Chloracidobacterium sp. MS 40/45]|uniref:RNA-guided endonuclease InsQ/TnpB family protein n=1 Tax=Chloracidobacterium aggregatum TaxID=2851959 RepID=UPI001B8CD144|nr:RNA-guided endonuclease TnpB family protein [Chloracidobacterium aggregatum]QUV99749.1 transposase [Chloracidobacterium sp. MS 40/45]